MIDLSIIIVSYNTRDTTHQCLDQLVDALSLSENIAAEIIVVDNASTDGSVAMLKTVESQKVHKVKSRLQSKVIQNNENLGFSKANNEGLAVAEGQYILFLNSDAFIRNVNFDDLIYYLNKNPDVGALTVKIKLPDGQIDMASHRGFPTIWRALTYFSKLENSLGKLPAFASLFGGYHLLQYDLNTIHEVDAISGAFFLTRKDLLTKVGGFDTSFFMYGDDLDLCYQIKNLGYKIIYYPLFTVLHLKYQSGLKNQNKTTRSKTKQYFFDAMRLFYDKHFAQKNNRLINQLVYFFINLKKKLSS